MTASHRPATEPQKTRRHLLLEMTGAVVLLAIPVGAALATAQPIVNPPGREELDVLSDERKIVLEQRAATDEDSGPSGWEKAREERKKARKSRKGEAATEEDS